MAYLPSITHILAPYIDIHVSILLKVITTDYQGCLRDVKVLTSTLPADEWTDLLWDSAIEREGALANWEGCPDNLEPAYHFLGTGMAF